MNPGFDTRADKSSLVALQVNATMCLPVGILLGDMVGEDGLTVKPASLISDIISTNQRHHLSTFTIMTTYKYIHNIRQYEKTTRKTIRSIIYLLRRLIEHTLWDPDIAAREQHHQNESHTRKYTEKHTPVPPRILRSLKHPSLSSSISALTKSSRPNSRKSCSNCTARVRKPSLRSKRAGSGSRL